MSDLKLAGVEISDVTRYMSDAPGGTVSIHVRIRFNDNDINHYVDVRVDLESAGDMSLNAIEIAALQQAKVVLNAASTFDVSELEAKFHQYFEEDDGK